MTVREALEKVNTSLDPYIREYRDKVVISDTRDLKPGSVVLQADIMIRSYPHTPEKGLRFSSPKLFCPELYVIGPDHRRQELSLEDSDYFSAYDILSDLSGIPV